MPLVRLGEDRIPWGEDDLVEYLSQYGRVVTHHGKRANVFYLLSYDRTERQTFTITKSPNTGVDLMVYPSETLSMWFAGVFIDGTCHSRGTDLLEQLTTYLEKRDEYVPGQG